MGRGWTLESTASMYDACMDGWMDERVTWMGR